MITIRTQLPAGGIGALKPGEVYERAAFTAAQIQAANQIWRIRQGRIGDDGENHGKEVIQIGSLRKEGGRA